MNTTLTAAPQSAAATSQPRRALLLANAQANQVQDQLPLALQWLRAFGLELIVKTPHAVAELASLIAAHREEVDCVIVGGGDGTLNAVADAMIQAQLPLGILPLGTANDLARTLGVPLQVDQACQVIAQGCLRRVDMGCVNGKHFFNAASLGLSVKISRQLDNQSKKRWGVLAYAFTAAKVLLQTRPFHAEIHGAHGVCRVKTIQITIGNGRFFGGGMTVDEDAMIDDRKLDLYSIEVDHWWQLPRLLWSLRRGQLSHLPQVRTLQGQRFEIRTRRPYWINTDGELTARTPAVFQTVPAALAIYTPRQPQAGAGISQPVMPPTSTPPPKPPPRPDAPR